MRIFVTGATGFIGSALVKELLQTGHQVLGMARSDAGAQAVAAAGAEVHRGELTDLEALRRGAAGADAVIHTAFIHDFSRFKENCEIDRRAIQALGAAAAGRPLLVTSGTAAGTYQNGRLGLESDPPLSSDIMPRAASEEAGAAVAAAGGDVRVVRLPQVHDTRRQGLITYLIAIAREKGVSAYIGDGANRWPAVPVRDAARLYRLALEKGTAGARYHAVAEEGVSCRDIAEVLGRALDLPVAVLSPEEAPAHFGWLAAFAARDLPASSAQTRVQLGWAPMGRGLLGDLAHLELEEI